MTKSTCCVLKRHGDQCTRKTIVHYKITSLQFRKKTAVFRVINMVTENLIKLSGQI